MYFKRNETVIKERKRRVRNRSVELSLKARVDLYKKWAKGIESYLSIHPTEWGKFQVEFNEKINSMFRDVMRFEKECSFNNDEKKLCKLKKIFMKRIKSPFERGDYIRWVVAKPYGYAGDFKYIEDIYENNPRTQGFDRLFDNYTMMSAIATAVRNRKNDFKRKIINYVESANQRPLRVMDLAAGPCREIFELKTESSDLFRDVIFDCYDSDPHSLEFGKKRLFNHGNVNFFRENAIRLAAAKNVNTLISYKYDVIYSTGLFDYFDDKVAERIISNLRKLLNPNGVLMISDVRDKYSNPSLHFMEWVGEWPLVYRSDEDFRKIFIKAGFSQKDLECDYEQQGILQYISAYLR